MKTKLFLFMAMFFSISLMAKENVELIRNGNFEDESVVTYELYESTPFVVSLPGWDTKADWGVTPASAEWGVTQCGNYGLETWNIIAEFLFHDSQIGLIDDDNYYFLRIERNKWNGWYESGIYQTVKVEAGEPYEFSCLYRSHTTSTRDNETNIPRFVRFFENGHSTATMFKQIDLNQTQEDWIKVTETITAPEVTEITILVGLKGGNGTDSNNTDVYLDIDNFSFFGPGDPVGVPRLAADGIVIEKIGSQIIVKGVEVGSPITFYGVSGSILASGIVNSNEYVMPVANYAKGLYIVKINNKSYKVIL